MNQKRKNAFTLIELLAVIVILAIIALIAVPTIMNIINKANKSAFKDTAYGIISAGELYFSERQLDLNGMQEDVTIILPDTTKKLELKGEVPEGSITISKEGKVALAVFNERYCITKGFEDIDVTVTENYEECKNPGVPIMTSENACVTSGTCTEDEIKAGILVNVKVNDTENYDFYVIADNGTELTLIMNQNLGDNVAWISADDYVSANTDETSCSSTACTDEGPVTAISALKERTVGWTNVDEREYTYSDDGGGTKYPSFTETMRARMLTYIEATNLGCTTSSESCPSWLYTNLYGTGSSPDSVGNARYGYWTSSVNSSNTFFAWNVSNVGNVFNYHTVYASDNGIRPVITISK